MKKFVFALITILSVPTLASEIRLTVSKANASKCWVIPAKAPKYRGRNVYHYAKDRLGKRHITRDLGQRGKGLSFLTLKPNQRQSMTAQLLLPYGKYFTFWYRVKRGKKISEPQYYDFEVTPLTKKQKKNRERIFVDLELEGDLPCGCFPKVERPARCSSVNEINIFLNKE